MRLTPQHFEMILGALRDDFTKLSMDIRAARGIAAEIDALRAELKESQSREFYTSRACAGYKEERDRLRAQVEEGMENTTRLLNESDREILELTQERDRLREALDNISCGDLELGESHPLARIARNALKQSCAQAATNPSEEK